MWLKCQEVYSFVQYHLKMSQTFLQTHLLPVKPSLHWQRPVKGSHLASLWQTHSSEQFLPNLPSGHCSVQIAPCQTILDIRSKLVLQDTIQTFYPHNLDYRSHWDDGNLPSIQPDRRRPRCPCSGPRSGRGISAGRSLYTSSHSCRSDRETETVNPWSG